MRTWEISNLGGNLPGGRRQKRQRPNLVAGRGQESRKVQLWRFEQLRGSVVFRESKSLKMSNPVGFGFWPVSEGGNVKHYASSQVTQKEVVRLSSDISKWLHRPQALKSLYTPLTKGWLSLPSSYQWFTSVTFPQRCSGQVMDRLVWINSYKRGWQCGNIRISLECHVSNQSQRYSLGLSPPLHLPLLL